VAVGEADYSVFSNEELDELVEVELDLPSSWGVVTEDCVSCDRERLHRQKI
jgi:hypothetical protein